MRVVFRTRCGCEKVERRADFPGHTITVALTARPTTRSEPFSPPPTKDPNPARTFRFVEASMDRDVDGNPYWVVYEEVAS